MSGGGSGPVFVLLPGGPGKLKAALTSGNSVFQRHLFQRLLTLDNVYHQAEGSPYLSRVQGGL